MVAKRRRARYDNSNFLVFYDNNGMRHILRLDVSNWNRNNSQTIIDNSTKEYIATTDMGLCAISQENITEGTDVRELKCGHFFEKKYIDIWLSENDVCPMCRQNFKN